ncbi:MAG: FKBP-type peptidyl-prolyl cis-trans isomerase, partial [bacterium]
MRKSIIVSAVLLLAFVMLLPNSGCTKKTPETQKDKVSYTIGWDIGSNIGRQNADIDIEILTSGIKDAMSGSKPLLTEDEMRTAMTAFQKEMQEQQTKLRGKSMDKNKKAGEEFLEKNRQKKDVKITSSGLQYKIVKEGKGKRPGVNDRVTVNYRGTLIDGTEFDSSYKRGTPATFPVSGVIKGWTEALQLMKEGAKYELFIPSELAYGERGAGNLIGSNTTLIFTVELLS